MLTPVGWKRERMGKNHEVFYAPNGLGMVTVDFEMRCFRPGIGTSGRPTSTKTYAGRGWKEAICIDAVAYLSEALWGPAPPAKAETKTPRA